MLHAAPSDLRGKHRTEPVLPQAHRLVADIDAALVRQVFDLAQGQGKADVHHHRQPDHLG